MILLYKRYIYLDSKKKMYLNLMEWLQNSQTVRMPIRGQNLKYWTKYFG